MAHVPRAILLGPGARRNVSGAIFSVAPADRGMPLMPMGGVRRGIRFSPVREPISRNEQHTQKARFIVG